MVEYEDELEAMDASDRPAKPTRMKSTIHTAQGRNIKGRGQNQGNDRMVGDFERIEDGGHHEDSTAQKSVDGWVVFCTNLHEEATTEDLQETFCEFGEVRNSWMNLDRQTGYVKGYALIEYRTRDEAEAAIQALDGTKFLDRTIRVSWAFVKPPTRGGGRRR